MDGKPNQKGECMSIPKFRLEPIDGGDPIKFPAPTPAAFLAERELRRDPAFAELQSSDEVTDNALANMLSNAGHAIKSVEGLKIRGVDTPKELTFETAYQFTLRYAVSYISTAASGDVQENPTGTTGATS